jgi:hypothetical protein
LTFDVCLPSSLFLPPPSLSSSLDLTLSSSSPLRECIAVLSSSCVRVRRVRDHGVGTEATPVFFPGPLGFRLERLTLLTSLLHSHAGERRA